MRRMKSLLLVSIVLFGCSDSKKTADAPPQGTSCATYCSTIMANCTGTNQQYSDMQTCTSTCEKFDAGTVGAMSGNNKECRVTHAGLAMTAPSPHCLHAGPGGGGACGMNCEGFCTIVTKTCATQYPDMPGCMTTCAMFNTTPDYNSMQTGGNTFACRLYHATAATVTPTVHCPHTLMTSATCQ
jgi:hypothetical protein